MINPNRFTLGIKISMAIVFGLGLIIYLIWLIFNFQTPLAFPFALYSFAIGGLMLTVSGCIGPGRFQKRYDIVLFSPQPGSAFSSKFIFSGFTLDDAITSAKLIVNGHSIRDITFVDNKVTLEINREEIIDQALNQIWIESKTKKSNSSHFTFFEYNENMADEEIDELFELENKESDMSIEDALISYGKKRESHIGSIALGIFFTSIIVMLAGVIFDNLIT